MNKNKLTKNKKGGKMDKHFYASKGSAILGLGMLLGWSVYMLVSFFAILNLPSISPEFYRYLKHILFVTVAFILVFKGLHGLKVAEEE